LPYAFNLQLKISILHAKLFLMRLIKRLDDRHNNTEPAAVKKPDNSLARFSAATRQSDYETGA
jgi:hypothetical protein